MAQGSTTTSVTLNASLEVAPILDPTALRWQRLASMDRQSPDFLPLLSDLTDAANQSLTTELRDESARIALGALVEVGRPSTVAEWSDSNLRCAIHQVSRDNRIPDEYERITRSVMRTLAHDSCQLPSCYQVKPGTLSEGPVIAWGASSEVRRGD